MTDRLNGFLVVLEQAIRDDDAEATINAIRQIKGVIDVIPQVADGASAIATVTAKWDLRKQMFEILK